MNRSEHVNPPFQIINIAGNLTRDPELRSTVSGKSVCDLRVAVIRPKKNEPADYVTVTCWEATAENCARYLSKGHSVAVSGRLEHSEWESEDGHRPKLVVVANQVDFLGAVQERQDSDTESDAQADQSEEVAAS